MPVCTSEHGSRKALDYLAKIQAGLVRETRADIGYTNFITKNPMHEHWRTEVWTKEAYELNYLADFVDLRPLTNKEKEYGLGRNFSLFDTVRHWAYSAIREHRGKTWEQWYNSVLKHAQNVNMMFSEPLPYSEIKATAKSIAKFCWKRDGYHYNEFIYRQALKGSKGGKASNSPNGGIARSAKYNDKRAKATKLRDLNFSTKEIAIELGVSDRTIRNWLKKTIS